MSDGAQPQTNLLNEGSTLAQAASQYFDNLGRTVWLASLLVLAGQAVMTVCCLGGLFYLAVQIEKSKCHCNMIPRVEASGNTVRVEQPRTLNDLAREILKTRGEIN